MTSTFECSKKWGDYQSTLRKLGVSVRHSLFQVLRIQKERPKNDGFSVSPKDVQQAVLPSNLLQIKAIRVHDFRPCSHKVLHELGLVVILRVDLRIGTQH